MGLPLSVEPLPRLPTKVSPRAGLRDEAHLETTVRHEGDRDAPGAHAADEGLRPIDRVDNPDARCVDLSAPGLLAEEGVLREGFLEPIPDQHLGVQVGLARHVLHPLALDGQGAQAVEVAEGEFPGFVDQSRGEFEAPLEGVGFHLCDPRFAHLTETSVHASFQSQAAPRTPLESPWTALRIGVSNTGEKV